MAGRGSRNRIFCSQANVLELRLNKYLNIVVLSIEMQSLLLSSVSDGLLQVTSPSLRGRRNVTCPTQLCNEERAEE